jgi:hypothetical protein
LVGSDILIAEIDFILGRLLSRPHQGEQQDHPNECNASLHFLNLLCGSGINTAPVLVQFSNRGKNGFDPFAPRLKSRGVGAKSGVKRLGLYKRR